MSGLCVICARMAPFASRKRGLPPTSGSSMLLCPEQNHTSPTRTSFAAAFVPDTMPSATRTRPVASTSIGARSTRHFPLASARASTFCPANDTRTRSPGDAVPHTGTRIPRCSTAPSENGPASLTSAAAAEVATAAHARTKNFITFFMAVLIPLCYPQRRFRRRSQDRRQRPAPARSAKRGRCCR